MTPGENVVKKLLEAEALSMSRQEHEEGIAYAEEQGLPIFTLKGQQCYVDDENYLIIPLSTDFPVLAFDDPDEFEAFLTEHGEEFFVDHHPEAAWKPPADWKPYEPPPPPAEISLEQKMPHKVFESGDYVFIKMPAEPEFLRREGFDMQHPVDGDTKVVTLEGTVPIRTLVGKQTQFLSRAHTGRSGSSNAEWAAGTVRSFGTHRLWEIVLSRNGLKKIVRATAEHRWYAYDNTRNKQYLRLREKTTAELREGNRIPAVYARRILFASESLKGLRLSPYGVAHGVVFGDGHRAASSLRSAKITLYGAKDRELLPWFLAKIRRKNTQRSVGGIELDDLPRFFKELPPQSECPAYLIGWLAGYLAADGNVDAHGCAALHSAAVKNLEFAETVCQRFGIRTTGITSKVHVGFGKKRRIHRLSFQVGSLPSDFFLLASHRKRVKRAEKSPTTWLVESVNETHCAKEVFCAIVPKTGSFVLDGNILTGNCLSVAYREYCERLKTGDQIQFSMVDKRDGRPKVDIELSITKGSYSFDKVAAPTVTQIRGIRNQCPPKDEYLPAIMDFFTQYGKGWQIGGHNIRNFDGHVDGDKVMARWQELQAGQSGETPAPKAATLFTPQTGRGMG